MNDAIDAACEALARGAIVAYPTEGVFGLGCDPASEAALERLLALKGRPAHKGLILIADRFEAVAPWLAPIPETMWARIAPTWPGPVTWLLPVAPGVSRLVCGDHDTLAVRVTAHADAAALCRAWGGPLVSTSANRADEAPARSADAVAEAFADGVDVVVDAPIGGRTEATPIIDARTGAYLRS